MGEWQTRDRFDVMTSNFVDRGESGAGVYVMAKYKTDKLKFSCLQFYFN